MDFHGVEVGKQFKRNQLIVAVRTGDLPDDISLLMVDTATRPASRRGGSAASPAPSAR